MISEPGVTNNWYPNIIEDVSGEIGVLYYRADINAGPGDAMFTLVIPPGLLRNDEITDLRPVTPPMADVMTGRHRYNVQRTYLALRAG